MSNKKENAEAKQVTSCDEQKRPKSTGRITLQERQNLRLSRSCLSESFEGPASERESWWRCGLKETPSPGFYEASDFIEKLDAKPNTYRFKDTGQRIFIQRQGGQGKLLLPGAYKTRSFIDNLDKTRGNLAFVCTGRHQGPASSLSNKDKDVNISPNAYGVEKYLCVQAPPFESWQYMFKSESKRFPTIGFKPTSGPSPCSYNNLPPPRCTAVVSSSFRSRTPRFSTYNSKNPGPGAYTPVQQRSTNLGFTQLSPSRRYEKPRPQTARVRKTPRHLF